MNPWVAVYAVLVGIFMLGLWAFLVATGRAELKQRPWDMRLHITAEAATAILLLASGTGGFLGGPWAADLMPVALGMLLYTVINSPGFYAGKGNRPMVGMFAGLAALTALAIAAVLVAPA